LAFLNFEIHRDNILEESIEKLGMIDTNLKNPLKIKFIGEEGRDEGGVQN
jgi:ubiquitin-protein ligase E3 A